MNSRFGKDQWTALFVELGLSDGQMWQWHHLFEARHPEDHARFLQWLGLSDSDIRQIRVQSGESRDG